MSLLIGLLPPLVDDAVSSSRAEVVDRDDTVKQRWVVPVDFSPVTRVPYNIAKVLVVLVHKDSDCSVIPPVYTEPVLHIVVVLPQSDVAVPNLTNNSSLLSIRHLRSFPLAWSIKPFLNSSGRVNQFVVLADLFQATLEQFKDNFFGRLVSLEGLLILSLLVRVPAAIRLWRVLLKQLDDVLSAGGLLLGPSRPTLRGGVLEIAIENIGFVQLSFRQFLVPAYAKAVDRVDAGVIYRPSERILGDLM